VDELYPPRHKRHPSRGELLKLFLNKNIMSKFDGFMKDLESASVLELNELVKAIEEKFGVSAAAVAIGGGAGAAPVAEEQSTYTVVLASAGDQKIAVMKVVKETLGLGLKDAKDLVDAAPGTLKEGMKKEEANDLKKKIEAAGGKIELK
jgi:large subunit ribosomal protein L7/L12